VSIIIRSRIKTIDKSS